MERRKFERYAVNAVGNEELKIEVMVEGRPVHLVDFSVGGLYVISEKLCANGDMVKISVDLENKGKISLMGKVVRTSPAPDESGGWGIAIDLTHTYHMAGLQKV
jgi:Tfp pilus assembly protein PilZ